MGGTLWSSVSNCCRGEEETKTYTELLEERNKYKSRSLQLQNKLLQKNETLNEYKVLQQNEHDKYNEYIQKNVQLMDTNNELQYEITQLITIINTTNETSKPKDAATLPKEVFQKETNNLPEMVFLQHSSGSLEVVNDSDIRGSILKHYKTEAMLFPDDGRADNAVDNTEDTDSSLDTSTDEDEEMAIAEAKAKQAKKQQIENEATPMRKETNDNSDSASVEHEDSHLPQRIERTTSNLLHAENEPWSPADVVKEKKDMQAAMEMLVQSHIESSKSPRRAIS